MMPPRLTIYALTTYEEYENKDELKGTRKEKRGEKTGKKKRTQYTEGKVHIRAACASDIGVSFLLS